MTEPAPEPCEESANHLILAQERGTLIDENVVPDSMASRIAHARSIRQRNRRAQVRADEWADAIRGGKSLPSESGSESGSEWSLPGRGCLLDVVSGPGRFEQRRLAVQW